MTSPAKIALGFQKDGTTPQAVIGAQTMGSVTEVIARMPDLVAPEAAAELARVITHFARGRDYRVITDRAAFEEAYRARIDSEDPAQSFRQGVYRLIDHGVPEFEDIAEPVLTDSTLTWCAEDAITGLPYVVTAALDRLDTPDVQPMPLTPLPTPPRKAVSDAGLKMLFGTDPEVGPETPAPVPPDWLEATVSDKKSKDTDTNPLPPPPA
ncbi:hypothetical protein ACERZ8_18915 [Tateyamaria armeniaca]|uniref:Uncharacterized protein n=1 Tax=Tateyamaria armeniaca TaxID=2518930 RepID=A0ABW8UXF6_9RHOB